MNLVKSKIFDNIYNLTINGLFEDSKYESRFGNFKKAITEICSKLDKLASANDGYILFEIRSNKTIDLFLITKSTMNDSKCPDYRIRRWQTKDELDTSFGYKIHTEDYETDLERFTKNCSRDSVFYVDQLLTLSLNDSFGKLRISTDTMDEIVKDFSKESSTKKAPSALNHQESKLNEIANRYIKIRDKVEKETKSIIENYINKIEEKDLHDFNICLNLPFEFGITSIEKVRKLNNTRIAKFCNVDKFNLEEIYTGKNIAHFDAINAKSKNYKKYQNMYIINFSRRFFSDTINTELGILPYDLIDKGRIILRLAEGEHRYLESGFVYLVSNDPNGDPNYLENFIKSVKSYISNSIKERVLYYFYLERRSPNYIGVKSLPEAKKSIMAHKFIKKKEKAIQDLLKITSSITFNGKTGELSYNNFSIAVNDEYVKSYLRETLLTAAREHLDKKDEQEILDRLINGFFEALEDRINRRSIDNKADELFNLEIIMNKLIKVNLEKKFSNNNSKLFYINGQRFNRYEVIPMLREISCYRDQKEVDLFINKIGKISLSTYIALTTGYEVKTNYSDTLIFRFKRGNKRSEHQMILDGATVKIKGKQLINLLYDKFLKERNLIGDRFFEKKLETRLRNETTCLEDYVKCKLLLGNTFKKFKEDSEKFLEKKIIDTKATKIKYRTPKKRKPMNALLIQGISGNQYAIAYDSHDSFVFMNPNKNNNMLYNGGKYICMVDQSNIKSNIGYDTVIAKLMSLKNDSVISKQIYNLEEELND